MKKVKLVISQKVTKFQTRTIESQARKIGNYIAMNKLTKFVDLRWRSLAINPDDDWIWYEAFKTLYTQMGCDLRTVRLTQPDFFGRL